MKIPLNEMDLIKRYFEYTLTFEELVLFEEKRLDSESFNQEVEAYEKTILLFKKAGSNSSEKTNKRQPTKKK